MEYDMYKLIYKIKSNKNNTQANKKGDLRFIGKEFYLKNKNKVKLIIKNKKYRSKEIITID